MTPRRGCLASCRRAEDADARRHFGSFPRKIGTDNVPALAAVGRLEQDIGPQIEGVRIDGGKYTSGARRAGNDIFRPASLRQQDRPGAEPVPSDAGGKYRFLRTAPLVFSTVDPHALYLGANVLFKTTNGGQSWDIII